MTNNEIINVATVSESSNLSEIGPIAPAGADDAKVVLNTRVPANTDEYHFIALEKFYPKGQWVQLAMEESRLTHTLGWLGSFWFNLTMNGSSSGVSFTAVARGSGARPGG